MFCSSSVVHMYHIACLYIGQHLYKIKWTVPLTFRPWEGHNFVIDLGATREVSCFSPKMEVWTQKEEPFSNSGETSTFLQQNSIQKRLKTGRCGVRTTKLVNSHFFAILSATPTSAATKILPVCHGCGTTIVWGTHIELKATASYFQIPLYFCQKSPRTKSWGGTLGVLFVSVDMMQS